MERGGQVGKVGLETEAAYRQFRRLLLGALARLSRQGFAVPPAEGLDLIHDFFAEASSGPAKSNWRAASKLSR